MFVFLYFVSVSPFILDFLCLVYYDGVSVSQMMTYMFFVLCTMMEYLCHKWRRICSVCRNHNPILSSYMTYHLICNNSVNDGCHMWSRNCLPFQITWVQYAF